MPDKFKEKKPYFQSIPPFYRLGCSTVFNKHDKLSDKKLACYWVSTKIPILSFVTRPLFFSH
jgi:hypothetical protein